MSFAKDKEAVVITGTSTGIGRACALHLAEKGYRVFAGVRKETDGDTLKRESSDRLTPVILDVTDDETINKAAELVSELTGDSGLFGLINNAGIVVAGPLEFISLEDFWRQLHVNLSGQLAVIQAFLPLLRKAKGRIINITSIGGRQPVPFMGPYCASKAAFEALTDSLRMELFPFGIQVSIVTPGNIKTPIWDKTRKRSQEEIKKLPPNIHEFYGEAINSMLKGASKMEDSGLSPEVVAYVVATALEAIKPRTRYIVGMDAKIQVLMSRFLPDRLRDRIVSRFLGIELQPVVSKHRSDNK
jgi:NAD(P)-dependent dehydrogenase (short-subunit alcohol dehydrogenase family)